MRSLQRACVIPYTNPAQPWRFVHTMSFFRLGRAGPIPLLEFRHLDVFGQASLGEYRVCLHARIEALKRWPCTRFVTSEAILPRHLFANHVIKVHGGRGAKMFPDCIRVWKVGVLAMA